MVKNKPRVIIENEAKRQLRQAYQYIRQDSEKNAKKVKEKILASIKALVKNPEQHKPDKYCLDNDGSFRAYEIYKYRITYHVWGDIITVVRIRHTKMNPLEY